MRSRSQVKVLIMKVNYIIQPTQGSGGRTKTKSSSIQSEKEFFYSSGELRGQALDMFVLLGKLLGSDDEA